MLVDYYTNQYQNRYSIFVNGYGSVDALEDEVERFTYGFNPVRHSLLNDYAKKAANFDIIKETYENSLEDYMMVSYTDIMGNVYFDYVPIYSLPDPKVVTQAEGDALTYAFVSFIMERV